MLTISTLQGGFKVSNNRIANILYNMSLDMDYNNYSDYFENEINLIENEINNLKIKDSPLFYILETIASDNENLYNSITNI